MRSGWFDSGPVRLRTVEMDPESIERSDFPLVRRGYDPAAVGAHLQALAAAAQELTRRVASVDAEPSLGTAAATRVQGILEAAQATAGEIEREARRDAQRTCEQAAGELERARAHVDTLARAAAALLAQVRSLDGEVGALANSLRTEGASRPGISEVDAPLKDTSQPAPAVESEPKVSPPAAVPLAEERPEVALPGAGAAGGAGGVGAAGAEHEARETSAALVPPAEQLPVAEAEPEAVPPKAEDLEDKEVSQKNEDLDGARLVALNMALSGEPREQTDRYLADSFQLSDRAKLIDEVYAAIEG
jgi:hypothetical protein